MRNWQLTWAFSYHAAGRAWEDRQDGCDKSGGGNDPDSPGAKWYGYRFDFQRRLSSRLLGGTRINGAARASSPM